MKSNGPPKFCNRKHRICITVYAVRFFSPLHIFRAKFQRDTSSAYSSKKNVSLLFVNRNPSTAIRIENNPPRENLASTFFSLAAESFFYFPTLTRRGGKKKGFKIFEPASRLPASRNFISMQMPAKLNILLYTGNNKVTFRRYVYLAF